METISCIVSKLIGEYKREKKLNRVSECHAKTGRLSRKTNFVKPRYILASRGSPFCQIRSHDTYLDSAKNGEHAGIIFLV